MKPLFADNNSEIRGCINKDPIINHVNFDSTQTIYVLDSITKTIPTLTIDQSFFTSKLDASMNTNTKPIFTDNNKLKYKVYTKERSRTLDYTSVIKINFNDRSRILSIIPDLQPRNVQQISLQKINDSPLQFGSLHLPDTMSLLEENIITKEVVKEFVSLHGPFSNYG
jgi:hypothetical protein